MKNVTHIFFDLDHTLWDYEANARDTLESLYERFSLAKYFSSSDAFLKVFHFCNDRLWHQYNLGEIGKKEIREWRFYHILKDRMEISHDYSMELSDYFVNECPKRLGLLPNAIKVLDVLSRTHQLGIITNGFDETQERKMKNSNIAHYFQWVVTSESAGCRKPARGIFDKALTEAKVDKKKVVMIGDNLKTDIAGANEAGWRSVWYNPKEKPFANDQEQVIDLEDLLQLL